MLDRAASVSPGRTIRFATEAPEHARQIDALIADAFGPGRYAKAAERLRENNLRSEALCVCALEGERVVGAVRLWPILIGDAPAQFLGPIAVDPQFRSHGLGAALIERACRAASAGGHRLVLLVGDRAFFEPLGFEPVPAERLVMPGPVDARRVLWRALQPGGTEGVSGLVKTRPLSPSASAT